MQLHTIMAGRGFGRIPTLSRSIVVLGKGRKYRPCSGGRRRRLLQPSMIFWHDALWNGYAGINTAT